MKPDEREDKPQVHRVNVSDSLSLREHVRVELATKSGRLGTVISLVSTLISLAAGMVTAIGVKRIGEKYPSLEGYVAVAGPFLAIMLGVLFVSLGVVAVYGRQRSRRAELAQLIRDAQPEFFVRVDAIVADALSAGKTVQ